MHIDIHYVHVCEFKVQVKDTCDEIKNVLTLDVYIYNFNVDVCFT